MRFCNGLEGEGEGHLYFTYVYTYCPIFADL